MGKKAILLPDEYREIAEKNGLSIQTVYSRIKRGWELEKAVTKKPERKYASPKRKEGMIIARDRPKGDRPISFYFYKDLEDLLEKAITESGLSRSEFLSQALETYLLKLWKPKTKTRKSIKKK